MEPNDIKNWRPTKFSDFVGTKNQRRIGRLQSALRQGRTPSPLLLVGVYGYGKTSLARLVQKSLCCTARDPQTADPCHRCTQCQQFGHFYHGYGYPYRRFECDCTTLARSELIEVLDEHRFDKDVSIFLDELHCLHEKFSQQPLLKFVEDFPGLFMAAIMEDRLPELIPPLQERLEILRLVPPTAEEMVRDFQGKMDQWNITGTEELVNFMGV